MTSEPVSKKVRIEHFKNLVVVANADGFFHEDELELLAEKAEEFGISSEDASEIIRNADNLSFKAPLDEMDKEDMLTDTVFMTIIDGDVHEKEYDLCLNVAEKLGFNKEKVDEIIAMVNKLCNL